MDEAPGRVVFEVPCPEVALGLHRFDVRHRAVLVAVLDPHLLTDPGALVARAADLVASGADGLEVGEGAGLDEGIEAVRAHLDVPVCVVTGEAAVLERALAAGAAIGIDPSGFADPDYLAVASAAGASVVAAPVAAAGPDVAALARGLRARAEQAEAAGIPRSQVLVDAGLDLPSGGAAAVRLLRAHHCLAALGWPLSLAVTGRSDDAAAGHAAVSVGVALGARVLRVRDVRGARRSAEVVAAILRARRQAPA